MKTKGKQITLALVIMLSLSIFASMPLALAQSTVVSITPSRVDGPPPDLGQQFTVDVMVSDVANLWGWKIAVSWEPSVLDFVTVEEGAFLKQGSATIFVSRSPDQVLGQVTEIAATRLATSGVSGSGVLCTITFLVDGFSADDSPITLYITELRDNTPAHNAITHTVQNGVFTLPPPPSRPPMAAFTPVDGAFFYVDDSIALDGSSSISGVDEGVPKPITSYAWQIDFGNDGSFELSFGGMTAGITAPATACQVKIVLTVTTASGSPGYSNTDSETHVINIVARPSGPSLDLWTNRGGEFIHQPADAFGPQELVELHALVTYNNVPVENKDVAFQIMDNEGNTIAYRTARTNSDGIAKVEYRIPWPSGPDPEALFGEWNITASVDVSQVVVSDWVTFQFGYVIEITDVEIVDSLGNPDASVARGQTAYVKISYKSIATIRTVRILITASVYDEAGVPVSSMFVFSDVSPLEVGSETVGCVIPSYAFIGVANAYGNAYSLFPVDLGVPFCPEVSQSFSITVS